MKEKEVEIVLSPNSKNLSAIIDALKMLIEQAETKSNHIDKLRQANFTMALFVFAGLTGFGLNQDGLIIRCSIPVVLIAFMMILSDYDNTLHKYLHGWRKTKQNHVSTLADLINAPVSDISIYTYYQEGEEGAGEENCRSRRNLYLFLNKHRETEQQIPSRMRVVYYLLVRGAIVSLIPFLLGIKGVQKLF